MSASENMALISRIRTTFFKEENVRAICRDATARDGRGLSIVSAHCEPLKHGFAAMFRDLDEDGGSRAGIYAIDPMTRDAFQLSEMLDLIRAGLPDDQIACVKDAFNRDSAREDDFYSTALEIWLYLTFFNPSNSVRFNADAVGWDVEVEHQGTTFTFQCKSVRYGLGRMPIRDARAFENLLHLLRLKETDPGAHKRFLGFELLKIGALKEPQTAAKVAGYVAELCHWKPSDGEGLSDVIRLVAAGGSVGETVEEFAKRFSNATTEGAKRPHWCFPIQTFPSADRSVEAGAIQFALPLDVEDMIKRCAKQFGRAMCGLRGRPNPVVVIGVEASLIRLREGQFAEAARLRQTMRWLAAEMWAAIKRKSQWPTCHGCLLVFKLPSSTTYFPGRGWATSLPLHMEWQDPEEGDLRTRLPPINTAFWVGSIPTA